MRVVLLCEIHRHREALSRALRQYPDLEVLHAAADPTQVLSLSRCLEPDVLLVDSPSGLASHALGRQSLPSRILVIGEGGGSAALRLEAKRLGKNPSLDDVYCWIVALARDPIPADVPQEAPVASSEARASSGAPGDALPQRLGVDELTRRETEISRLVARGLSNKEIAAELHISEPTVKNHVHRILGKLGMRRRMQLISSGWAC